MDSFKAKNVIDQFNDMGYGLDVFKEKIGLTDEGMIKYLQTEEKAINTGGRSNATFSKYTKSLQATGIAMNFAAIKAELLNAALNTGIMFIASLAIEGVVKLFDSLITTTAEYNEKVEESSTAYEEAKSKLESVNQELYNQTKAIDDLLSKGSLTYAEQDQLENLQSITEELRIQKDLLEKQTESAKKDLGVNAANAINSQYDFDNISSDKVKEYYNNSILTGKPGSLWLDKNNISSMLAGYEALAKLKEEAFKSGDTDEYQHFIDTTEDVTSSLWDTVNELQEKQSKMHDYYESILKDESLGKALSSDQKKVKSTYEGISNAIKLVYSQLAPDKWNNMQLSNILSAGDIEVTLDELIKFAKDGKLDEDTISSYKNLNNEIKNSDLVLSDGTTSTNAFINVINELADSQEYSTDLINSQTESLYALATATDTASGYINDLGKNVDISKLQNAISTSQTSVNDFKTILSDLDKYNDLTSDNLDTLTQKYPKFLAYINNEQELRKQLKQGILDQETTQKNYYQDIIELDTGYYKTILVNNSDLVKDINSYYDIDLANYKSLAQAKYEVDTTLRAQLSQKWAKYYKARDLLTNVKDIASENKAEYKNTGQELLHRTLLDPLAKKTTAYTDKRMQDAKADAERESKEYEKVQKLLEDTNIDYTPLDLSGINISGKKNTGTPEKDSTDTLTKFSEEIDFFVEKEKVLENTINKLNSELSNATTVELQKDKLNQLNNSQAELIKTYQVALGTYKKSYDTALKNKYLTEDDTNHIKNGDYSIGNFKGKGKDSFGEKRYNAIQKAIELRDKVSETTVKISDSMAQLKEDAVKLADISWDSAKAKADKINNSIELLNQELDNANSTKEKKVILTDILAKKKEILDTYTSAVKDNQTDMSSLYNKIDVKNRVNTNKKPVASGTKISTAGITDPTQLALIVRYNKQIDELTENTSLLALEQEKYKKDVKDTDTEKFNLDNAKIDESLKKYTDINDEIQNSLKYVDGNSNEQITLFQAGLLNAKNNVSALQKEINKLNKSYQAGKTSEENYKSRLSQLNDELNTASSTANSYYNNIIDKMKELYDTQKKTIDENYNNKLKDLEEDYNNITDSLNEQLNAYKNIIDAKKKSLEADKEAKEYQDSINEQTDNINTIQSRMADLKKAVDSGDRGSIAEYKQLQNDLKDAREKLDDTQYNHQIDLEEDALDDAYDGYEQLINDKLNSQKTLYEQDKKDAKDDYDYKLNQINILYESESELIKAASQLTSEEFSKVFESINNQLSSYGLSLSPELTDLIKQANAASNSGTASSGNNNSSSPNSSPSLDRYEITKLLKTGKSLTGDSDLNKYIKSKYDSYLTFEQMVKLAQMLGLNDIKTNADVKGNSANRNKILKKLQAAKFSTGGTVDATESMYSELSKLTGEDGIALVKHNEEILTSEKAKLVSNLLDNIKPLNDLSGLLYNTGISTSSTLNNNSSPIIQFNLNGGTISKDTMSDFNKWKSEIIGEVGKAINNKMRIN
jgi:hypothetical protein